ncbi:ABC transporter substrate-binding protein [Paenibacillus assamensis]|uniref:ABC transporter substrate-binding protein n=1 Tax=Paenibacillus assamensis TaxID=311244 RepID=UPI000402D0CE|nr:extracellular solute-binding protein [Paenibacillus assamensis]
MKKIDAGRHGKLLLIFILVMTMLSACTGGAKSELPDLPEDGSGKIRVMYYSEQRFMSFYAVPFKVKYPNIEFEIVPASEFYGSVEPNDDYTEKLIEFIKKKKLDVVLLGQREYEQVAGQGILYPLDSLVKEENYPIDDFHPGVIEQLRQLGGNTLYGLATAFQSSALFYNVDLFEEYGVELPRHKMSVSEVLELAARFESKSQKDSERIYGMNSTFMPSGHMLQTFASMAGLQMMDQKAEKIVMDSEAWESLFIQFVELIKDKKWSIAASNGYNNYDPSFGEGRSAMTIGHTWMMRQMNAAQDYNKDKKMFKWGVVTVPINPAMPDESSEIQMSNIFAMTKDSTNKRAAWEFIKFSAGIEMAKIRGKSSGELTTRSKYQKDLYGMSVEAFTMLKPSNAPTVRETMQKNNVSVSSFFVNAEKAFDKAFKSVVDGKKTAEQAYDELVPELQKHLDEARRKGQEEQAKKKK